MIRRPPISTRPDTLFPYTTLFRSPYEFLPLDTRVTKDAFGEADDLAATQPIRFASADDPPALLIAGGEDELVLPSQSTGMAIALVEAGAAAEIGRAHV